MATTLSPGVVLRGMADALPTHPEGDESSDLASSYEVIGLFCHAGMVALGFELCGFDEDKDLAECRTLAPRLPSHWNSRFGSLSFVYAHGELPGNFVLRIDRMGSKVEVRGFAAHNENIHRFEHAVRHVVQGQHLPLRITLDSQGQEDREDLVDKMRGLFVSEQAIDNLISNLKDNIVDQLRPQQPETQESQGNAGKSSLQTDSARAEANDAEFAYHAQAERSERQRQESRDPNYPVRDPARPIAPLRPEPVPETVHPRPMPMGDFPPPGFEDEHQMNRPPPGLAMPGRAPYNIGHDDLNPPGLGPHDPLRGSFVGGGLPRPGGGSGMHPTFDDPLFGGPGGAGQGDFSPQAPPGARWDPLGPGGNPRYPGPGGGQGNSPFGGFGGGGFL